MVLGGNGCRPGETSLTVESSRPAHEATGTHPSNQRWREPGSLGGGGGFGIRLIPGGRSSGPGMAHDVDGWRTKDGGWGVGVSKLPDTGRIGSRLCQIVKYSCILFRHA